MTRNRDEAFKTNRTFNIVNPISQSNRDGIFKMSSSSIEKYKSNLYTLIFTSIGERPMEPYFGTLLRYYLFDQITDETYDKIKSDIIQKVSYWIPELQIDSITFEDIDGNKENNRITIKLSFHLTLDPTIQDFIEIEMGV